MTSPDELETAPPYSVGRPLDTGYLLEEVIGAGAAGRVWRGRRASDGTVVAIKVLHPRYSADEELLSRFVREHATLKALRHPHLVRVLDLVSVGDTRAIVMEMVDGQNLRRAAATGAIDAQRAAVVLSHLAQALAHIHAAGVVHRDVKPENVLVTWRGGQPWAQLTDFGIVFLTGGPTLTGAGEIVGTPEYVAPEVAVGRAAGPAADVYALGITAYELLAGHRPFAADHPLALLHAHVETAPPRPAPLSDTAWEVVSACLAKDPAARPPAAALAHHLANLAGSVGVLPLSAPPPHPALPTNLPQFHPAPSPSSTSPAEAASSPPTGPAGASSFPFTGPADAPSRAFTGPADSSSPRPASPFGGPAGAAPVSPHLSPPFANLAGAASAPRPASPLAGPADVSLLGAGAAMQELPTAWASRPAPHQPLPPPKSRRRWIWWVAAVVAVLVVAWGAGLWAGRAKPPAVNASPTPATKGQLWFLPLTVTSPTAGTVRLDFADATKLPGFESYVVYLDQGLYAQVRPGQAPPYFIGDRHPQTKNCYQVAALVFTDQPKPPDAPPVCVVADGKGDGTP